MLFRVVDEQPAFGQDLRDRGLVQDHPQLFGDQLGQSVLVDSERFPVISIFVDA